ncbi:1-propanol dehydrogenase PduQ [Oceanobacillus sp. CAU 1775]
MNKISLRTEIYSGKDALNYLTKIENKRIFIVADPFLIDSDLMKGVEEKLKTGRNKSFLFSDVIPDPPIENVVSGVSELYKYEPNLILTIGGGSAIDAAKAIKEFAGRIFQIENLPLIAIPTTSGTGSEVTSFSIITDNSKGIKYPLVDDSLIPDIAILDPNLVRTMPATITADTGMDALTHSLEAYVATNANDFSDALVEKAVRLLFAYLPIAYSDGDNIRAREKVHHASTMAGIAFNTAGLGINHSIAHACGAKFHIPHGRLNAILLPKVIAFNAGLDGFQTKNLNEVAKKYSELAKLLDLSASNPAIATKSLIKQIEKLRSNLDMPKDFKSFSIDNSHETIEEISEVALKDSCTVTNPVEPKSTDIKSILKQLL